ncbi:LEAF RUST 10 DISEASE-RESISTANCE LOCUS RECEPTOR-LIKE PROTEIN KINASE-like 2.1 isoform X2 [Tripterygium wilfordii]|uniref:LEAF RUST 10 DISEASE-RESISTANCE LOCUS RECEPTOR-LIKE PROTEIN KINASE-like 2.1 isoform X2 n=1 Tax=Tripterygium wilfordii TaxID=458696 RepID=UPI0018F7F6FE|nr:LEAF RUST 10 DISEASE-RESISTANCE LOCUS RECEPTOR-LIKE PROTEIN KINASE-like 2.1 isoform X2 [Tripterygium wilfordii]
MNHTYYFFFFFVFFVLARADDQSFSDCSVPYACGELVNITYPFWGNIRPRKCGLQQLELTCGNNASTILINQHEYQVVGINTYSHTTDIQVKRSEPSNEICSSPSNNASLVHPFYYPSPLQNLTLLYNCIIPNSSTTKISSSPFSGSFTCFPIQTSGFYAKDPNESSGVYACAIQVKVPVETNILTQLIAGNTSVGLGEALGKPFLVSYDYTNYSILCDACEKSGGNCGTNLTAASQDSPEFICFCRDRPHPLTCDDHITDQSRWKLKVGIGFGSVAIMCTMILIVFYVKRKILSYKDDQELEAIIHDYGPLPLKRYSFSDIKKITCSFEEKLGQGGYGCVYKGKLLDGCLVAVKVLNTTKGNGQDFVNEVLSISRTSHVNIVTLLGFCLEGNKRALIYEFMSNGSLEKFLYDKSNTNANHHFLGWENMFRIAVEIAQGLEYLHRGCKTRILHFDIKPHNILLDEDFCPKISDFGLAKLCIKKESIVSVPEARGTIGYIAPELFSRNFGGVSHKSDVYSYGMMILEMVGARKNTNINGENSSEKYFPHWIYKRLEEENDFGWNGGDMTELENEAARKMVLVGLWCIQTDPSQRPNISKVLDMLKGSVENLQVPPRPFVASPSRSLLLESFSSSVL